MRDAGKPFLTEAAVCKILSSEVAERVASLAVNLFGGNGFVKEYPVEKFYRDAKIGQIYEAPPTCSCRPSPSRSSVSDCPATTLASRSPEQDAANTVSIDCRRSGA